MSLYNGRKEVNICNVCNHHSFALSATIKDGCGPIFILSATIIHGCGPTFALSATINDGCGRTFVLSTTISEACRPTFVCLQQSSMHADECLLCPQPSAMAVESGSPYFYLRFLKEVVWPGQRSPKVCRTRCLWSLSWFWTSHS